MTPFWIDTRSALKIAIVPRPGGGDRLEAELRAIRDAGVDILVSMLEPDEADDLGLGDEAALCGQVGLDFRSFPVPDRTTPDSFRDVHAFVSVLRAEVERGKSIATHCRASIGRSSLMLACLMCELGCVPEDAFRLLSQARGAQVPDTSEQVRWVERYAEHFGDRRSSLPQN